MKIPDIKNGWIWLILLSVAILSGDLVTGSDIQFTTIYVLPIVFSGWIQHKRMAYALAILFPVVRLSFFIPWDAVHDLPMGVVNAAIQAAVLIIMAFLAGRARGVTELKKQLKILHGILPICMLCKKIRNEKGEYEQLEALSILIQKRIFSTVTAPAV